jgi:2-(1,2-epoxy-1,2-dihydrophenyl)acetyl-CoA isomerase
VEERKTVAAAEESTVLVSRDGQVATVTLNRPRRKNAVDEACGNALLDALRSVERDPDVRVVVLTGAGGAFCSGADLTSEHSFPHPLPRMEWFNEIVLAVFELSKPTIAKVDGVAVGAGWNLALGCDLVAASTAARFSQIFVRRALSVDFGGSWLLPRLVGLHQAKRLALLGEFVDAAEARELGLVTWVRPPEELDEFVAGIAGQLAASAPIAVAQTKALLNAGSAATVREALENEARAQSINFATEDFATALKAFQDGTTPEYTGR